MYATAYFPMTHPMPSSTIYWILALKTILTLSLYKSKSDSLTRQTDSLPRHLRDVPLPLPPRYQGRLEWLRQTAFDRPVLPILLQAVCEYRLADQQIREGIHAAYPQIHASGPDSPQAVQALTEAIQAHIFCPLEALRHEHLRFMRKYS